MTESGRCLKHGYVIERCCALFEPLPRTSFLKNAVRTVRLPRRHPYPDHKGA